MRVTIYHGYEEDGRMVFSFDDPATPSLLVEMYSYFTEDYEAETIYRRNNAVDGTEENVKAQARSLSVGDIVKLTPAFGPSTYLPVETMGFETMTQAEFDTIPQTTMVDIRARQDALNAEYAARRNS